ncbi:uncharacterized protein TRIVIDRAFT_199974 [Trichoderma virens Gv29-8]|uniref:Uncharacterized protein n=1 Tax=Hypocrea virens (strain Gv29-8 / FGSC 10586) TaxID=413071 RepID=G9MP17_HYPVG|nr:uncharacterized protein TRIVIDRAFT_199974 [Trichoderma virens Gv29-8]EHK23619.1 hypothetical protein TRIVIDRAFT_199974 [Trichoderma virens Gv29-8]
MASPTAKLMTRSDLRRMALQSRVASQMATNMYRFNQSIITPNVTKTQSPHRTHYLMDGEGTVYDPRAIVRVLIPISIAGWLLFGVICILCINGKGKLGRWVPEWYLDSQGTKRDKAVVVLWWVAVMVLWPVILPVLLVRKVIRVTKRWIVGRRVEARILQPKEVVGEV